MNRILSMLRLYLSEDLDMETLENHVIVSAPNAEGEFREFIDQIAVEIFYVWDGVSDEDLFRERVAELVALASDNVSAADRGAIAVQASR